MTLPRLRLKGRGAGGGGDVRGDKGEAPEKKGRPEQYERLLQSIYDAVFVTTDEGFVIDFNDRALEAFRMEPSDVAGASILDFLSGANPSLIVAVLQNLQDHRYTVVEARCLRRDGTTFQGEIAVNRINLYGHGELCFLVRDISVRCKAQQDLQHAMERVKAISRARMEFVSNVSHELRTPLTSMIYAVRNMQSGHAGVLGERAMQYLARLDSDCKRLLGTVNDILDLRQIENNTLVLSRTRAALRTIVEGAVDSLRVQLDAKPLSATVRCADAVDFVDCDVRKMERVFVNIVGNALKFTPPGGEIAVDVGRAADAPGMAAVMVSDTGSGIPPEAISKVTARYFQVGDQPVGTGLGLSITKELVEMHGGKLKIESPVPGAGGGTRVTVSLPAVQPPRVLLLGKAGGPADAFADLCGRHAVPCWRMTSGHAAIRKCLEAAPDAVVLFGETDDLASCDVAVQFRNDRRLTRLPVLFVTDAATAPSALAVVRAFKIPTVAADAPEPGLLQALLAVFAA